MIKGLLMDINEEEFERVSLVGGFNIQNMFAFNIDTFRRKFKISEEDINEFQMNSFDWNFNFVAGLKFLNIQEKIEEFCNKNNLNTFIVYLSSDYSGELIFKMEIEKVNLAIIDSFLMFMTSNFGLHFLPEEIDDKAN